MNVNLSQAPSGGSKPEVAGANSSPAAAVKSAVAVQKTVADDAPQTQQPSKEQVQRAMEQLQKAASVNAQNLQFSMDQETGKTIVKVVDISTKEVIRQIPSEEVLAIAKSLDKLQGLLLRQQA